MNPEEYRPLFRMTGRVGCLHTELFLAGPMGRGNTIALYKDGVWHTFIHKEKEKECMEAGLALFQDEAAYQEYAKAYREYIDRVRKMSIESRELTEEELREIISMYQQCFEFYAWTEWSYHELAYERMRETNDPVLTRNLHDLGQLKMAGREVLNAWMFTDGIIASALKNIETNNSHDDLHFLYSEELLDLLRGRPPPGELPGRKLLYGAIREKGLTRRFSTEEVESLAEQFLSTRERDTITGTTAHPGRARGRVVIAPMLTDPERVQEVHDKMEEGDILVAQSTTPELLPLCKKAAAIVTDQGGMLSHAAVVSRELGIPCVIGTEDATRVLQDGDVVEVDAGEGRVQRVLSSNETHSLRI